MSGNDEINVSELLQINPVRLALFEVPLDGTEQSEIASLSVSLNRQSKELAEEFGLSEPSSPTFVGEVEVIALNADRHGHDLANRFLEDLSEIRNVRRKVKAKTDVVRALVPAMNDAQGTLLVVHSPELVGEYISDLALYGLKAHGYTPEISAAEDDQLLQAFVNGEVTCLVAYLGKERTTFLPDFDLLIIEDLSALSDQGVQLDGIWMHVNGNSYSSRVVLLFPKSLSISSSGDVNVGFVDKLQEFAWQILNVSLSTPPLILQDFLSPNPGGLFPPIEVDQWAQFYFLGSTCKWMADQYEDLYGLFTSGNSNADGRVIGSPKLWLEGKLAEINVFENLATKAYSEEAFGGAFEEGGDTQKIRAFATAIVDIYWRHLEWGLICRGVIVDKGWEEAAQACADLAIQPIEDLRKFIQRVSLEIPEMLDGVQQGKIDNVEIDLFLKVTFDEEAQERYADLVKRATRSES